MFWHCMNGEFSFRVFSGKAAFFESSNTGKCDWNNHSAWKVRSLKSGWSLLSGTKPGFRDAYCGTILTPDKNPSQKPGSRKLSSLTNRPERVFYLQLAQTSSVQTTCWFYFAAGAGCVGQWGTTSRTGAFSTTTKGSMRLENSWL